MFFTKKQTLKELIVEELTNSPNLELADLRDRIQPKLKKSVTIQAWYKILRNLIDEAVVFKHTKRYILNTAWLVEVLRWSHRLKHNYLDQPTQQVLKLPNQEGQKIKYTFSDLISLNTFWAHVLVHIASQHQGNNTVYAYNPHFWFYLAHGPVEEQYNRSMREFGARTYLIIGGNKFLDTRNEEFFPKDIITYWFSSKLLYPDVSRAVNYQAGYLMEIKLPKPTAWKIHEYFTKVNSFTDMSELELISFFQKKVPSSLTISKNKEKSERFKRKIMRNF